MKKVLKAIGLLLLLVVVAVAGFALFIQFAGLPNYPVEKITYAKVEPTPELVMHGAKIASLQCNMCHGGADGKLTGKLLTDIPKEFGEVYSRNITQDKTVGIGAWSDADIAYLLRTGCRPDGSFLPLYMPKFPHMSDYDLKAVIAYLRSDLPQVQASSSEPPLSKPSFLTKFLSRMVIKKIDYPKQAINIPDSNNAVAYGKYLVTGRYDCWPCHSADFKTINFIEPEKSPGYCGGGNTLLNLDGKPVYSANITMDEKTGLGTWNEDDFVKLLSTGHRKDDKTIRYPMMVYNNITENEMRAIWQYLRTLPTISNEVNRQWDADL